MKGMGILIAVVSLAVATLAADSQAGRSWLPVRFLRVDWSDPPGAESGASGAVRLRLRLDRWNVPDGFDLAVDPVRLTVGDQVLFDSEASAPGTEVRRGPDGLRARRAGRDGGEAFVLRIDRRPGGPLSLAFHGRRLTLDALTASESDGAFVTLWMDGEGRGSNAFWVRTGPRQWAYRSVPLEVHDPEGFTRWARTGTVAGTVVRTKAEWVQYHLGGPIGSTGRAPDPPVDFGTDMVVLLEGLFPSTGWFLAIDEVVEERDRIVVRFTEGRPCSGGFAITGIRDMRSFARSAKPVEFLGTLDSPDCR